MVFNIKESTSDDVDDRKLYDLSEADRLLNNELNIGATVTNPVRLGLKREDSKYPRPLRITVNDEEAKWKILKAAKNLAKSGEENYKTVFIKRDMTMEREQDVDLRRQLAEKKRLATERGETTNWTIRRGKVINLQRRQPQETVA